jgi:uncharacterized protein YndB with AHSA1/START domain
MRIAVIVGVVLLALVCFVGTLGAFVPKAHVASRTVVLNAPPARVWGAITTVEAFGRWRNIKSAVRLPPHRGRPSWREVDSGGDAMTFEVIEEVPGRRLVTRIADKNLPFGGTWTYELVPSGRGTQLTIIEDGRIENPFFRCIARFVLGYRATMDQYLASLRTHVEKA